MKNIILCILAVSFLGCVFSEDEKPSIIGSWYEYSQPGMGGKEMYFTLRTTSMVVQFDEKLITTCYKSSAGSCGTFEYVIDGDSLRFDAWGMDYPKHITLKGDLMIWEEGPRDYFAGSRSTFKRTSTLPTWME